MMTEMTLFESVSAIRSGFGEIARFSQNLEKTANMGTIEERAQEYAHQYRRDAHDLKGELADALIEELEKTEENG